MSINDAMQLFLEDTCYIQISVPSPLAPVYGCKVSIVNERLIIAPNVLHDYASNDLLLSDLEIIEFNGSDTIIFKTNNHPEIKTITIVKEKS